MSAITTLEDLKRGIACGKLRLPEMRDEAQSARCDCCGADRKCKPIRRPTGTIAHEICPQCASRLL